MESKKGLPLIKTREQNDDLFASQYQLLPVSLGADVFFFQKICAIEHEFAVYLAIPHDVLFCI